MIHKDYRIISESIRHSLLVEKQIERGGKDTKLAQISLTVLARNIARKFAKVNKKFDVQAFYSACGIEI